MIVKKSNTTSNKKRGQNQVLDILKNNFFINPTGTNLSIINELITTALNSLINNQGDSPIYPTKDIPPISEIISNSKIPLKITKNPSLALNNLHQMVQGSVKSGHPFMVKNLIPTASIPSLATYMAVSPYMGNAVTGEDAGQTVLAEIACASAIARLAGYNPQKAAGIFTFGGTGTNLYAMKIGLSKIFPNHHKNGLKKASDIVIIESAPAHYSHKTGADWLGIGQNACVMISSNLDQTTKLDELESECCQAIENNKYIACINAVGGTTSNMAIDDIKKIYDIRKKLVKKYSLNYSPHLHVDGVLGWAYLNFNSYNFGENPFNFNSRTLLQIKKILKRVNMFKYADSFGIDFHKTGYMAYNSSMIIVKNKMDLMRLRRDSGIMTPLFHDNKAYNPGEFTLETSRSAANILATWIGLQTFGQEGYQALLGHAIEMGNYYQEAIEKNIKAGICVANKDRFGPDIFIRCYPPNIDPETTYEEELKDDGLLDKNSEYSSEFTNWLLKKFPHKNNGFAISKSSAAIYTHTGKPMPAIRIYPLSPYITKHTAYELIKRLVKAKCEFDKLNINQNRNCLK